MNKGDIIKYSTDKKSETGTVVKVDDEYVTVTKPDNPNQTWTILRDRVITIIKKR